MTEIKDHNGKVLHAINRDFPYMAKRFDLAEPTQFIQVAALRLNKGDTFKAHQHIWNDWKGKRIPQESWVVISGQVLVTYYDTKGQFLANDILNPGDCSITFEGGHNYKATQDNTRVYEFKTGPYFGQEFDKVMI